MRRALPVAKGIEVDWVVIRVNTVRRLLAVVGTAIVAASLIGFAYLRINLPPEARARQAIERATVAQKRVEENPLPERWQGEISQAITQLASAKKAFAEERWEEATQHAVAARTRFENILGLERNQYAGVGQIFSLEGRVMVQRAGTAKWVDAHRGMPVFNGDFVKSFRDGTAEILFADGSLYSMSPDSQLEIHEPQSTDSAGSIKMMVGRININTGDATSIITTENTQTKIDSDSKVAVDIDQTDQKTTVAAYSGRATVKNPQGQEMVLANREQVAASVEGTFSEKTKIPPPPLPISPKNNTAFDLGENPTINLKWRSSHEVEVVYLQVSRSKRFTDFMDIDRTVPRREGATIRAVAPGTYYWRVASGTQERRESEWSPSGRFQVMTPGRRQRAEDTIPPELRISNIQQLGNLFIIEGDTEVGALVTINNENVELEGNGHFRKTIEFKQEGQVTLTIVAIDPAGNRQTLREAVFVEF